MGAFGDNDGERSLFYIMLWPFMFIVSLMAIIYKGDINPMLKLIGCAKEDENENEQRRD